MPHKIQRKPFYLFATLDEELATSPAFWRRRTPGERLQYLHHLNTLEFGKAVMNALRVRCYGLRKLGEDPNSAAVVYF